MYPLHPITDHSAQTVATYLYQKFCRFGIHDELLSDPGSDLMSERIILLNEWFGIDKLVILVDRHEFNGVEPANKQILRHLFTVSEYLNLGLTLLYFLFVSIF